MNVNKLSKKLHIKCQEKTIVPLYKMSIKEPTSKVLRNLSIFDFCRSVAYCCTK
jgi:hypothetical protein